MKPSRTVLFSLLIVILCLPLLWSCKGTGSFNPNQLPITRLANVPPPDTVITTANPRLTLYWIGDDPDGFVVAFQYRWSYRQSANGPILYKPYTTILNLWNIVGGGVSGSDNFALLTDAAPANLPAVYHYFSVLLNGLDNPHADSLSAGDTIHVSGAHVWASNTKTNLFPVHTKPTSGTFIFDSPDSLNPHTFEVLAVDNLGARGLPAKISFNTPRVSAPKTELLAWPLDTSMVLSDPSVSWPGIQFTYQGFDPNSRTLDYEWVVDRDLWPAGQVPWSPFTTATAVYVTAKNFPNPLATNHTFYVRARNEFGVIDTIGSYIAAIYDANSNIVGYDTIRAQGDFKTLYPPFKLPGYNPRLLVINNSYSWPDATPGRPSTQQIDQYYSQMLNNCGWAGKYDIFDVVDDNKTRTYIFPSKGTLAQYSIVIFVADAINCAGQFKDYSWGHPLTSDRQAVLEEYLNVGGRMIISAWGAPWPLNLGDGQFMTSVCHMQNDIGDVDTVDHVGFIGATGVAGYPNVVIDTAKALVDWPKPAAAPGPPDTTWGFHYSYVGQPSGFGEIIYRYVTTPDNIVNFFGNNIALNAGVCGTRYQGITYNVVYMGFPLYFVNCPGVADVPSATAVLRKALTDVNQ